MFVKVVFHIFILIGKTGTLVPETDFTIGRSLDVLIYGYGTEFVSHNASRHRVLDICNSSVNIGLQRAVLKGTVAVRSEGTVFKNKVEGAALLRAEGIKVRIVSVPSEGLFRSQSKEYQESILPAGSKIFGLTAGLPVNLEGLVGPNGKVWGLESFGFSAPYKVLDEKLGFTAKNVYNQVKELLA